MLNFTNIFKHLKRNRNNYILIILKLIFTIGDLIKSLFCKLSKNITSSINSNNIYFENFESKNSKRLTIVFKSVTKGKLYFPYIFKIYNLSIDYHHLSLIKK